MHLVTRNVLVGTVAGALALGGIAFAQTGGHDAMNHAAHSAMMMNGGADGGMPTNLILTEPGQGAFAALSEIVRLLEADPETDWSKVKLTALRDHLIDMDRLVRDTVVEEEPLADGIRATVTGDPAALAAAKRMVPAHAAELAKDDRWTVEVTQDESHVVLVATSADPATVARIQGLGFFGLMASQDHHRQHHLMIALGGSHMP
jgi:hypothetical protein